MISASATRLGDDEFPGYPQCGTWWSQLPLSKIRLPRVGGTAAEGSAK